MKTLLILLMVISLNAKANSCYRYTSLNDSQKHMAVDAYLYGMNDDLGYTLAAIAMQESSLGLHKMNYISRDFGLFQINITTASTMLKIRGIIAKNDLALRLINDNMLNSKLALGVLSHFKVKSNWRDAIRSYNQGYRWRTNKKSKIKSDNYLSKIIDNVNMFKRCMQ